MLGVVCPHSKLNLGLRGGWDYGLSRVRATFNYVGAATYPIGDVFASLAPFGVAVPNERVASYSIVNLRLGYHFAAEIRQDIYEQRDMRCRCLTQSTMNWGIRMGNTIGRQGRRGG